MKNCILKINYVRRCTKETQVLTFEVSCLEHIGRYFYFQYFFIVSFSMLRIFFLKNTHILIHTFHAFSTGLMGDFHCL